MAVLGIMFVAVLVGIIGARIWLWHVLSQAGDVLAAAGLTGEQVVDRLITGAGLHGVTVERIEEDTGSDHYDPGDRVVRLSGPVLDERSVRSSAIVAHEVGHAMQHADGMRAFRVRARLAPATLAASWTWLPLLMVGLMAGSLGLAGLAVLLYAVVVMFELVTLPVEINASRRAMGLLSSQGLLLEDERPLARRVLRAAAMTYVVAAAASVLQLVWTLVDLDD
jgi:Zn-dependent membrane protease YugP